MDAVLNWLWQGGVVAVALGLMLFSLERASANVRSVVCWAAALFVIALPALPSLPPTITTAALPDAFRATGSEAIVSLPEAWWTSTLVILAGWTLWAGIQIVRFISAIVAIRRARARSRAFPSHAESVLPCWRRVRGEGRRCHARLVRFGDHRCGARVGSADDRRRAVAREDARCRRTGSRADPRMGARAAA